ncbi:Protein-glutamate methylesterase/protein-glutamine glutaminase [Streptomyces alboniger]
MTDNSEARQGPIRVMVVDDHPMWRDAVARDLGESGFDVVATAGDGGQAVRRAKAAAPDVLVLDLNLPAKPGARSARNSSPPTRRCECSCCPRAASTPTSWRP